MSHPSLNYPSPAEVKIFIGQDIWIDDAFRVDYNLSNNRTPLYDYTSQFFKAVAEGHALVQGQLMINFRFPGYLSYAMDRKLDMGANTVRNLGDSADIFREMSSGGVEERVKKLLAYKRSGAFEYAKTAAATLYSDTPSSDFVPNYSSTHKRRSFDIVIKYGGMESLYDKIITDCFLVGESQVISAAAVAGGDMSSSGMPIYEVYNFFGKAVKDVINQKAATLNKLQRIYK